jgi:peptidoglycan/LPS O-acetylase OafA/YrhL
MDLYSIWPCVLLLAFVLLMMGLDRPFAAIDGRGQRSSGRYPAIDGLRGLLAFGVFGHHAVLMHGYLQTGIWRVPPSDFYTMMGEVGVALFFAITGFLFWGKLLQERGAPDWAQLYIGRFFRIAPVYLAVVSVVLLVVWNRTYFELQEPLPAVLFDTARWLGLGVLGQPDVNGYPDTGRLLAGVTWTLRYEWLFYFSLPLLALFARVAWHLWFTVLGLAACCVLYALGREHAAIYAGLFFCGMIAASLAYCGWRIPDRSNLALAAALGCLMLLFTHYSSTVGVTQVLLLGILFGVFSIGGTFARILAAKPVRRLGEISYSLYLLHGLVLTAVFSVGTIRGYAMADHFSYWLVVGLCGLLTVLAATLSYLFIERPGIRLGKAVAGRLAYADTAEEGAMR